MLDNSIYFERGMGSKFPKKVHSNNRAKYYLVSLGIVFLYRGDLSSCKDTNEERNSLKLESFKRLSAEDSAAALKAETERNPQSPLRGMTRLDDIDLSRLVMKFREHLDPIPQIYKYFHLPDGQISFVFEDGYELWLEDKRKRDDGVLKTGEYTPITTEGAVALMGLINKGANDPQLHLMMESIVGGKHPVQHEKFDASVSRRSRSSTSSKKSRVDGSLAPKEGLKLN